MILKAFGWKSLALAALRNILLQSLAISQKKFTFTLNKIQCR